MRTCTDNITTIMSQLLNVDEELYPGRDIDIRIDFGTILSAGQFTMVIRVDWPYVTDELRNKLKNPVLIISKESDKLNIMESLFPNKILKIDIEADKAEQFEWWLEEHEFDSEEAYREVEEEYPYEFQYGADMSDFNLNNMFDYFISEYDLNIFYMEEFETASSPEIDAALQIVCSEKPGYYASDFIDFTLEVDSGNIEDCAHEYKEFEEQYLEHFTTATPEEFQGKVLSVLEIIERDISKVAKAIVDVDDRPISLDLHSEQFLMAGEELYLTDPFVIE